MVRHWQGKEENDESSVSEYIATLKANMQEVRDLAYDKERDETWPMIKREMRLGL